MVDAKKEIEQLTEELLEHNRKYYEEDNPSISDYEYIMPDESTVSGYRVALSWTYTENLGYDTEGVLVLIPDGNKMGVVYFNPWENKNVLV